MPTPKRSSEEIRRSIEANTSELSNSIAHLRGEVTDLMDWKKQARAHKKELVLGTVALGVAIGIGLTVSRLFRSGD